MMLCLEGKHVVPLLRCGASLQVPGHHYFEWLCYPKMSAYGTSYQLLKCLEPSTGARNFSRVCQVQAHCTFSKASISSYSWSVICRMLYDLVAAIYNGVMLQWERILDVPTILLLGLAMPSSTWLLWRLWSFTVLPNFRPEEPKELPYLIPCKFILEVFCFLADSTYRTDFGEYICLGTKKNNSNGWIRPRRKFLQRFS